MSIRPTKVVHHTTAANVPSLARAVSIGTKHLATKSVVYYTVHFLHGVELDFTEVSPELTSTDIDKILRDFPYPVKGSGMSRDVGGHITNQSPQRTEELYETRLVPLIRDKLEAYGHTLVKRP